MSYNNPQMEMALEFLRTTGDNIFLTGKAGTGKTTFLKGLAQRLHKRMVVAAPTGVAALNAGGVTLHSLFQLPFIGVIPPGTVTKQKVRFSREKIAIIRSIDLLVIDEVSMVRADVMDAVSDILRRYRNPRLPFGGVQLLMIGDVQQLAPVTKSDEIHELLSYYSSPYFFDSLALKQSNFRTIELQRIYRQQDAEFIELLAAVRENRLSGVLLDRLNARYIPDFSPSDDGPRYITLTSHVSSARSINERQMRQLDSKEYVYKASIVGDFPAHIYPNEMELKLKLGAQVMFLRNDPTPEKLYYNGKIGRVTSISESFIKVTIDEDSDTLPTCEIMVQPTEWSNTKYSLDGDQIVEQLLGTFIQFPLQAAWAITIHKSQGLTFAHAVVDAANSFSHGQVYVALSRCQTLEGLVLSAPLTGRVVICDEQVSGFCRYVAEHQPTEQELEYSSVEYFDSLVGEMFEMSTLEERIGRLMEFAGESLSGLYPALADVILPKAFNDFRQQCVKFVESTIKNIRIIRASEVLNPEFKAKAGAKLLDLLVRASGYYHQKIDSILTPVVVQVSLLDLDNKENRRRLKNLITEIDRMVTTKLVVFEGCSRMQSFSVDEYLALRAKAIVNQQTDMVQNDSKTTGARDKKIEASELDDIIHPELFNTLRAWRLETARAQGTPVYGVFAQKVLIALTNTLPTTSDGMKRIKGVGPSFMEKYSHDVATIIADYIAEKHIENTETAGLNFKTNGTQVRDLASSTSNADNRVDSRAETKAKEEPENKPDNGSSSVLKPTKQKIHTSQVTLELFESGMTVERIAEHRSLTKGTIMGHFVRYIESGEFDVLRLIDRQRLDNVCGAIERALKSEQVFETLTQLKESLNDEFTFAELRFAQAYIARLQAEGKIE